MAYYDALIAKWATLTPGTTAQKLTQINALTVQSAPNGLAILSPSAILNAIVFADLVALSQLQIAQLTLLLQGSAVDASIGTSIRLGIQTLFSGKTQTLSNLAALVAPSDAPIMIPWWKSAGYPVMLSSDDLAKAGLS
jgi:hypothetical protein